MGSPLSLLVLLHNSYSDLELFGLPACDFLALLADNNPLLGARQNLSSRRKMKTEKQIKDRIKQIDFELTYNRILTIETMLKLIIEKRALLWVLQDEN